MGENALNSGDILVADNAPVHRHQGGRALSSFILENFGVEYVNTPSSYVSR